MNNVKGVLSIEFRSDVNALRHLYLYVYSTRGISSNNLFTRQQKICDGVMYGVYRKMHFGRVNDMREKNESYFFATLQTPQKSFGVEVMYSVNYWILCLLALHRIFLAANDEQDSCRFFDQFHSLSSCSSLLLTQEKKMTLDGEWKYGTHDEKNMEEESQFRPHKRGCFLLLLLTMMSRLWDISNRVGVFAPSVCVSRWGKTWRWEKLTFNWLACCNNALMSMVKGGYTCLTILYVGIIEPFRIMFSGAVPPVGIPYEEQLKDKPRNISIIIIMPGERRGDKKWKLFMEKRA